MRIFGCKWLVILTLTPLPHKNGTEWRQRQTEDANRVMRVLSEIGQEHLCSWAVKIQHHNHLHQFSTVQ